MTPTKKEEVPNNETIPVKKSDDPDKKPKIPGLPEKERLKIIKKKKNRSPKQRKNQEPTKKLENMKSNDFLVRPATGSLMDGNIDGFSFSDQDDENESDAESYLSDESFEDSKDTFSDDEHGTAVVEEEKTLPPKPRASARAASTSTPSSAKRIAGSPADPKLNKKARGRSKE